MSTLSLPSYIAPSVNNTPSYSAEPQNHERRLAFVDRLRPGPSGTFWKTSKGGEISIRLIGQEDDSDVPVYNAGSSVQGAIQLARTDSVQSIVVKVEGNLLIKELAEGGTTVAVLLSEKIPLWTAERDGGVCPTSLPFSVPLPSEFTHGGETYPLPPNFYVKLSGLPGFIATIEYNITASMTKVGHLPKVKSKSLGIRIGEIAASTSFNFCPRSRPAKPIPPPLSYDRARGELISSADWRCFEAVMKTRSAGKQDVLNKLYVPSGRVFAMASSIPFYLTVESSAVSLAAYLPLSPTTSRKVTRIQLMRQITVDVRNTTIEGVKTDMWRVDCLGEGTFEMMANGPTSITFKGSIRIDPSLRVPAFRAAGLSIKDCILFTVNTLELAHSKAPFGDVRLVVPIRLATDPPLANATGAGISASDTWDRTPSPATVHGDGDGKDVDDLVRS